MRIVLLNTAERDGGAAVAAGRLMRALRKAGVEVSLLTRDKRTDDPAVVSVNDSPWTRRLNRLRFVWERLVIFLCNGLSRHNLFQVSIADTGTDVSRHPLVREADIIHLHWVNQGFLSLADLRRLVETGKPIVWTLHDLWPATAICHYPGRCERYGSACRCCPMLRRNPLVDLAYRVFRRKERVGLPRIMFVGCSRWIVGEARRGLLLREARFTSIPNPIDTGLFHPMEQEEARRRFGLPIDKRLMLFAAAKLSDTRKGAAYLVAACDRLRERWKGELEVVLMGNASEELAASLPFPAHGLGYISDSESMAAAYACADLFVIPSLEDNLPNTIMEAMACGTPCVGFATGGIPEMIDHRVNGYVAARADAADLAEGIAWVLECRDSFRLGEACRRKVLAHYQESVVAERYEALYRELL